MHRVAHLSHLLQLALQFLNIRILLSNDLTLVVAICGNPGTPGLNSLSLKLVFQIALILHESELLLLAPGKCVSQLGNLC